MLPRGTFFLDWVNCVQIETMQNLEGFELLLYALLQLFFYQAASMHNRADGSI
jgi:hypothetical protein